MNLKKLSKWFYSHQVEVIVIIISIITLIIGLLSIGIISILIVAILDALIFFGPTLYQKLLKLYKKVKKESGDSVKKEKKLKKKKDNINLKKHNDKKKVSKKEKKPKKKKKIFKVILLFILVCIIIGLIAMCLFFAYIAKNAPKFNSDELFSSESTLIYANDEKTIIAKLGAQKREKITYDQIPEVFVDALIATEDSRFFQHNGFDFPRFMKAAIQQLLHRSGGGASTLTMQLSKNTYTSTEAEGIEGIIRKFTDIYLSIFEIEKKYSKQEIIEFYVNNSLLGGNNYGIEQASLSYFGKSAKDLNLSEAAILAGMYQSPNTYNPITKPENAAYRRSIVLRLMVRHGYITQEEADAANSIPVESLIVKNADTGDNTKYQGFIDTVVSEIKKDTGHNPYTTAMKIYTTLDPAKQDVVNDAMSGKIFTWENDKVQGGVVVLDTKTGAIVAVGTNRDSSASGLLNHATFENQTKRQIGSTAKPLYDYGPAIEYNNISPGFMIADEPYQYSDGHAISNFDAGYQGWITYRSALAGSRNITALKVFQSVKKSDIIKFVTGLGLSPEISGNSLHEAHSIGGYNGESPLTMAAAYATIGNMGVYNSPYSYKKIIYRDTGVEYVKEHESHRVMSEESAYILNSMLISTAQTGLGRFSYLNGWTYGAKTGTSNFSEETKKQYGLSSAAINDLWIEGVTDEYTISVWYGYDKIYKDAHSVFGNVKNLELFHALASRIWTRSTNYTRPSGVIDVEIERDCVEAKLASAYTPAESKTVELFKKGSEPTEVSTRFAQLKNVSNLKASSSNGEITLTWDKVKVNWMEKSYLESYYKTAFSDNNFLLAQVTNRMNWNTSFLGEVGYDIYKLNSDDTYTLIGTSITNKFTFEPDTNLTTSYLVKTAYTKYKANESTGTSISAKVNGVPTYSVTVDDQEIIQGEEFDYKNNVKFSSTTCKLSSIYIANKTFATWDEANTEIKQLTPNTYTLKVQYTCGLSSKTVIGSGILTIKQNENQNESQN